MLLKTFVNPNQYLALETMVRRIYRGTNHGGGAGLNKCGSTHDDEDARSPWIITRRPENAVELTSRHWGSSWTG